MTLASLLKTDADLSGRLRVAEKPGLLRSLAVVLAHSGDSWFWGAGLIILWLLGDANWKEWGVIQLLWISLLAVLVMSLKFLIRRRRPAGEWGAIYRNTDPHSFPSGHAARAFLIAVLGSWLGPAWLAALLWLWAPLVALARVAMGVHYVSDILGGMVVGVAFALLGIRLSLPVLMWAAGWLPFPLW